MTSPVSITICSLIACFAESRSEPLRAAQAGRLSEDLSRIWTEVGAKLPADDRIQPEGLSSAVHEIAAYDVVVITLPKAEHVTEVHFAAVVVPGGDGPPPTMEAFIAAVGHLLSG